MSTTPLRDTPLEARADGAQLCATGHDRLRGVGPEDVRRRNRSSVIGLLYPDHSLSRADVAKHTGLSKSSASDVITSLLDDGLIREEGMRAPSGPGRPAIMLHLVPDARQIIALDISHTSHLEGIVTNLTGRILARDEVPVDGGRPLDIEPIVSLCLRLRDRLTAPALGVGVATPGTVDGRGVVVKAANLGWRDVDLASLLSERVGLPVRVDNNANVSALAELQYGAGQRNMIFVQIARGLGAGMIIDNRIVTGTYFSAGEIGHVAVDDTGPICGCGKRGCLETLTSLPVLRKQLAADPSHRDRILTQAGSILGQMLSMPIAMAGVADIVISGDPELIDDTFLAAVSYAVSTRIDADFLGKVVVRRPQLDHDMALLGESASVLRATLL